MKKFLAILLSAMMLISLVSCGGETAEEDVKATSGDSASDGNIAVIDVKDYGVIKVELYPEIAPVTVDNFKKLVNKGFYNGLTFHRVIANFMIQGGGFDTDGNQKSSDSIKGEFSANGYNNTLSHKRGVISMGRIGNMYDSASCQFFICHADSLYLDGQYASFGEVIEGIEVVDKIAVVKTDANDKPLEDVVISSIHLEEKKGGGKTEENAVENSSTKDFGEAIKAEIEMADGGIIKLDLYPEAAPITVENFVTLAKSGFYDGLKIHRVSPGFVIQGGDPEGTGYGGSDKEIKGEFSVNGVDNPISHKKGVISMARASYSYDSASSQFFICLEDVSSILDTQYAAFGCVTEGMDVVEEIGSCELVPGTETPAEDIIIKAVRILEDENTADTTEPEAEKGEGIETSVVTAETTDPSVNEKLDGEK